MRVVRDAEWLKSKLVQVGDCLEYHGQRKQSGYGVVEYIVCGIKIRVLAHRLAWEVFVGPIPDGMSVLHKCDRPPCCNPEHLFLGTAVDNVRDMISKGRANHSSGEAHYSAKFTIEDVKCIRALWAEENPQGCHEKAAFYRRMAERYGVTRQAVMGVTSGKTWKNTNPATETSKPTSASVLLIAKRRRQDAMVDALIANLTGEQPRPE